jgi:hypothetical protein
MIHNYRKKKVHLSFEDEEASEEPTQMYKVTKNPSLIQENNPSKLEQNRKASNG